MAKQKNSKPELTKAEKAARAKAFLASLDDAGQTPAPAKSAPTGKPVKKTPAPVRPLKPIVAETAPARRLPSPKMKPAEKAKREAEIIAATPAPNMPGETKEDPKKKPGNTVTVGDAAELMLEFGAPEIPQIIDGRPAPYYGTRPNPRNLPKKWQAGELVRGLLVFYKGIRHWVESAPKDWSTGCMVMISDHPVATGPVDPNRLPSQKRESFAVPADCLDNAPQISQKALLNGNLPTVASMVRAERAAQGQHDVGDEVATKLRECKTLEEVYKLTGDLLACSVHDLKDRYGHLNPGQQRMNLGNRLRAAFKKGKVAL